MQSPNSGLSHDLAALTRCANEVTAVLRAIGNPHRLLILCMLEEGEASVSELQSKLSLRQSLVSQHLTRLRAEGLVISKRREQFVFYAIADKRVRALIRVLQQEFVEVNESQFQVSAKG